MAGHRAGLEVQSGTYHFIPEIGSKIQAQNCTPTVTNFHLIATMTKRQCRLTGILMFVITTGIFAQENWVALFNGKDLEGWDRHSGEARFFVEGGCIVGESVEGKANTFLCHTGAYADFELELDYLVDEGLNSGVQFRSELFPEPRKISVDGRTVTVPADRVHGYQCEIDMAASRMWTAGVYDEMRRNWLYPGKLGGNPTNFTQQGRAISQPGEWNRLRIQCVGPSIKTWLNGELRTEMNDAVTLRGRIGLQVHGVSKDRVGRHVKFRNIRLREIEVAPNPRPPEGPRAGRNLFRNGQDQNGWRRAAANNFSTAG